MVSLHVAVTLAFALLPGGEQVDMGHSSASLSFAVTGGEQVYRADTTFTWGRPILHQTGRILRLHGVVQFCFKPGGYYVHMGSSSFEARSPLWSHFALPSRVEANPRKWRRPSSTRWRCARFWHSSWAPSRHVSLWQIHLAMALPWSFSIHCASGINICATEARKCEK